MIKKLLGDHVLIELEDEVTMVRGSIIRPGANPVRIARVLQVGPGRRFRNEGDKFIPMQAKPGDRFPFFKASTDSKTGRAVAERLPEGQEIIRETDILFVFEPGENVEVTLE